ncbi:MAG: hypothetical protein Q7T10_04270 [Rhodoferax sp.]|uniref:hypothetical protein n=1 Tax=Rhodoferax sp. TaxID=50421 RepID=UPI00271A1F4E|nr:hypothetical protein [Rhodoferax sp.]MDO8448003.1 hypothetical protein [Rhodoferax sp.]
METKMQSFLFAVKATLALALCSSGWSLANETTLDGFSQSAVDAPEVAVAVQPAPIEPTEAVAVSGFGVPMTSRQLGDYRGGFDLVKNDMKLSGTVADNAAVNVTTGSNYIADGAFTNASGFPTVIQNSGSNVLIQNATIINLQYQ